MLIGCSEVNVWRLQNRGEKRKKSYFQGNKENWLHGGESLRFTVISLTITPQENDEDNSLGNLQKRNGTLKEREKGVVRKEGSQNIIVTECQWKIM